VGRPVPVGRGVTADRVDRAAACVVPRDARLELARRYLHIYGPTTPEAFARWAGLRPPRGVAAFQALGRSLTPVRTPVGDAWILSRDEPALRAAPGAVASAQLLPSGDAYLLQQGADRGLLVPDADLRRTLWTPRVAGWPARGWRGRRHVAARRGGDDDPALAAAVTRRTRCGRGRSRILAAPRRPGTDRRSLGRLTKPPRRDATANLPRHAYRDP